MPVCRVGTPCGEPASGSLLVFSRSGHQVAETRVDASGRYHIRLARGIYTVTTQPSAGPGVGLRPTTVRVVAQVDRRVDFSIDTGIR
jgi:hypothetical protein